MLRSIFLSCVIFWGCVSVYAATDPAADAATPADVDIRMARFFAGVSLIRSAPDLGTADKAERLRELADASGVTVAEAVTFLNECRSDPELWKILNESILVILTELPAEAAVGETPASRAGKQGE